MSKLLSDTEKQLYPKGEQRIAKVHWLRLLSKVLICGALVYTGVQLVNPSTQVPPDSVGRKGSWALNAFHHHASSQGNHINAEEVFLSTPGPESALAASRKYATHPHIAGSTEDLEDAKLILQLFQEQFGIDTPLELPIYPSGSTQSRKATTGINSLRRAAAWVDVYYPVLNTPLEQGLHILDTEGNVAWTADLVEDGDPLDPEAAKYKNAIPAFHGLSADGEAEGQLIYVNYGSKEDYEALVAAGVNFTDKIVLARYGANFRGLKIEFAQDLGAVGVLIYTDPRDDGSVTVENGYEPYPAGPARNPTSVQRGSVQFLSKYPGDPTTPGYPAYENATRTVGENIPKIPSLPISWGNAQRLLAEVGNSSVSRQLNGKVNQSRVKLVNHVDTKVTPIWNTMAVIPGHIKNETVIVGCHRDAWVMGAADPTSGTVSLHEVIRGFSALLKSGWKPLRNVVFASWDAEEYGLVGSVEWAEDFPEWISANVVAYLNVDVSVAGSRWQASGSPSLAHLIRQAAVDIPHPTVPGQSLWDASRDSGLYPGPADAEFLESYEKVQLQRAASDTGIGPLGSGSDYTALLQRLGVASMDQGFGPTASDPPYHYHSIYDSQRWQEVYADPGFHRHVAVAKHLGLVALRLTDAVIVPLNTTQYSLELRQYLEKVETIALSSSLSPDFTALHASISKLQSASVALDHEKFEAERLFKELLDKLPSQNNHCSAHDHGLRKIIRWIKRTLGRGWDKLPIGKFIKAAKRVQAANAKLIAFERGLISEEGIKGREWYKHLGVAPGKWLGYGATTLPAITEALTLEKNATLAEYEADRFSALLDKLSEVLSS